MERKNKQNTKATIESRRRQIQSRLNIIAPLYLHGHSYREIRAIVMETLLLKTYSLQTLKSDIDKLTAEWYESRKASFDQNLTTELMRIDELIKESWMAWEKSKEDYDAHTQKQKGIPDPDTMGGIVTTSLEKSVKGERCCGDVRYLEMINKLLMERRRLLGLYAAEKHDLTGTFTFEQALIGTSVTDGE